MITKENAIELLKRVGKVVTREENGSSVHITEYVSSTEISHLIAYLNGEDYDDAFETIADKRSDLYYLENNKEWLLKRCAEETDDNKLNKLKEKLSEREKEIKDITASISKLEKHIEDVNNETLKTFEDKSKIYRVKKFCREDFSNVKLSCGRLVYIDNIEIVNGEVVLHNMKFINFFRMLDENYFEKTYIVNNRYDSLHTIEEFNEYFEKV